MKANVYAWICTVSETLDAKHASATVIGEMFGLSRSVISQYLNQWYTGGELIKVNSRPVLFFERETLERVYGIPLLNREFSSMQELQEMLKAEMKSDFDQLIGGDGSLRDVVKQCKATASYPPNGLPILLHGPTGTGKSLIARLMYEYACNQGYIKSGKFVTVNCSEYANNPELLSANLFGSIKGAYTGAEKDNPGLLHAAEGGVLFLDEVHCLKAECQEKLFLFMDQGIYHMVGDNETWHHGTVRLVFATTEDPEKVLLKTLLRRIVMIVEIPPLSKRGNRERLQLIHTMFERESNRIHRTIAISNFVYNTLLTATFNGNIGELENCIQAACVQALFDQDDGVLEIHGRHLRVTMLDEMKRSPHKNQNRTMIRIDSLKQMAAMKQPIIKLLEQLIHANLDLEAQIIRMRDGVAALMHNQRIHLDDYQLPGILEIWEKTLHRYGMQMHPSNDFSSIYFESMHHEEEISAWLSMNDDVYQAWITCLHEELHREMSIALEIMEGIANRIDQEVPYFLQPMMALLIHEQHEGQRINRRLGVILAHGKTTASSIADAVNQFVGQYIFDAIDMPLHVTTVQIMEKLHDYLEKNGRFEELVLLVDMGSLEDMNKGLSTVRANIGIMNNVNTRVALEVGSRMMHEESIAVILKDVAESCHYHYEMIDNRDQEKVIICSCASGLGAAEKLKEIIVNSLPKNIPIRVLTCEYHDLLHQHQTLCQRYNVICTVGTLNPNLEQMRFVPIEDLIINETMDELDTYFAAYLTMDELKQFKQHILRNFSLSNIMNHLTILNPNKLLEHVAEAIDHLQTLLDMNFSNHTCFGLYVHICCLIERLVTRSEITDYGDLGNFEKNQKTFIQHVHTAFQEVEAYYHISINVEEIGYVYDYIHHN